MTLLIVDDQPSVVEGLLRGVDWFEMGFSSVLTALNVLEARTQYSNKSIDVLLCDIEMPMENGLSLLAWIREQKYETRCIFLTAHASFQYAQEALKLGGFDYIIQPAPYKEIRRIVQRAIEDLQSNAERNELYNKGKLFRRQEYGITSNVLRNFLLGSQSKSDMDALEELGTLPRRDKNGYLVLLQIVKWQSVDDKWDSTLLAVALANVCSDIFASYNQLPAVSSIKDNLFALVIQGKRAGEADLEPDAIARQLLFLNSVCEQYVKCSIACYIDGPLLVNKMPESWCDLEQMCSDNVALKTGIFQLSQRKREPYSFHVPQIKRWQNFLQDGFGQAMEEEANQLLDRLTFSGQMNASTLNNFYQDFLEMLYHAIAGSRNAMQELFHTPEHLELYRNGMRSVDQMKKLIKHVVENYKTESQAPDQDLVKLAIQYINDHLDNEIRRDELADYVHLNADYLTRIFKKETGYTLKEYVILQKMQESRSLLRTTNLPVSFIAAKVGYYNFSHFSFTYKKVYGITPLEERQDYREKS